MNLRINRNTCIYGQVFLENCKPFDRAALIARICRLTDNPIDCNSLTDIIDGIGCLVRHIIPENLFILIDPNKQFTIEIGFDPYVSIARDDANVVKNSGLYNATVIISDRESSRALTVIDFFVEDHFITQPSMNIQKEKRYSITGIRTRCGYGTSHSRYTVITEIVTDDWVLFIRKMIAHEVIEQHLGKWSKI